MKKWNGNKWTFLIVEKYYDSYKPKEVINKEKYKSRKQYIMIGTILFIILLILYLLKK